MRWVPGFISDEWLEAKIPNFHRMVNLQPIAVNGEIAVVVTDSPFYQIAVSEKKFASIELSGDVYHQPMFADATTSKRLLV